LQPVSALLLSNLRRRPARAALTALGTAVGVATVVALLSVSAGAQNSARGLERLGGADAGLFQKDAADPTTSVLPASLVGGLARFPGVARAEPLLLVVNGIHGQPGAIVFGIRPTGFVAGRLTYLAGRPLRNSSEAVVGEQLASAARLGPGSALEVRGRRFNVVGVFHTGVAFENGGAMIDLGQAQQIAGLMGEVTTIAVVFAPRVTAAAEKRAIARAFPGVTAIDEPGAGIRAGVNSQLVSKTTLVIVVLALLLGGIGVANTMLMAVLERRSEFALLAAVGWSGLQVAGLVLAEGVVVSMLGAALGLLLGVVGSDLLVGVLGVRPFVSPDVTAWGLGRGLLIGIAIGVLGGLYPAWRVTRLPLAAALARR
jgi:putative ABC transport system permease protein